MGSLKHLKEEAFRLRKAGLSYSRIMKSLDLKSKGTLSAWFKNIQLNEDEVKRLKKNNELASKRGLQKFNDDRTFTIKKENEEARNKGRGSVGNITQRELALIGVSLYWGEGTKAENPGSAKTLALTNSDPLLIKVFMKSLRELWHIPDENMLAGIHIYPTINEEEAKKYWSNITKLPKNRFYIVKQISRSSGHRRPQNSLPYGTLVIKVKGRLHFFRMKGMIQGLVESLLKI